MCLEICKTSSVITNWEIFKDMVPLINTTVIVVIGFIVNKKFEKHKSKLSIDNTWKEVWANKLLDISNKYSNVVTELLCGLSNINDMGEKSPYTIKNAYEDMFLISKLHWDIQNYTRFSENNGEDLLEDANSLYGLLQNLIDKKQGNLEEIRKKQFSFNDNANKAHLDILR